MSRSLQRHLSLNLGIAILLAGLAAAIASFGLAYYEAREFQDDMLLQIATLSADHADESSLPHVRRSSSAESISGDRESRIVIIHLPNDSRPDWLAGTLQPGFHTLSSGSERLRVFIRDMPSGRHTIVAQPTDTRDEIAVDSALRTLIPLLFLLPVLIWLIARIVHGELAPISRLARNLDQQSADRPRSMPDAGLPDEITPFVHAINRLLERVNHLMGQQRRFVADAAHELRSPLTALSVQAQNLRQAGSLEAMRERVAPLQEGIERARKLTEQLLSLARTQAGSVAEEDVNVSTMTRELIAQYLPMAEAREIDLGLEEIAPLVMRASPEALRLIIKNALENALKHTPGGGEVTVRLMTDRDSVIIEIVDNGPGIPVSERERVFDPFYQSPGSVHEGSGLGLAISREAAIRLGGGVSLHDNPRGSGLVFRYRQRRTP